MRTSPLHRSVVLALALLAHGGLAAANEAVMQEPEWVQYRAEKLVVDGVVYLPDGAAGAYRPGVILVTVRPQRHAEFADALHRFELGIASRAGTAAEIPIEVPVGYETHWVAALRAQPCVRHARLRTLDIAP